MAVTLTNFVATYSLPQYLIGLWAEDSSIPADGTGLIEIELLSSGSQDPGLTQTITGVSYINELLGVAMSCNSTNFDIRVLNVNDITALGTVNEIMTYNGNNLLKVDHSFNKFIVRNRDNPLTNKLYFYIENHDSVNATGDIIIELIYVSLQTNTF